MEDGGDRVLRTASRGLATGSRVVCPSLDAVTLVSPRPLGGGWFRDAACRAMWRFHAVQRPNTVSAVCIGLHRVCEERHVDQRSGSRRDCEWFAAVWGGITVAVTMTMDREYLKHYSMAAQHASQVDYYLPRLPQGPVIHRVRAFALILRQASLLQRSTVISSWCTHALRRGKGGRRRAAAVHRTRTHGLHHRAKGARAPLPTCSVCRTLSEPLGADDTTHDRLAKNMIFSFVIGWLTGVIQSTIQSTIHCTQHIASSVACAVRIASHVCC